MPRLRARHLSYEVQVLLAGNPQQLRPNDVCRPPPHKAVPLPPLPTHGADGLKLLQFGNVQRSVSRLCPRAEKPKQK